ncbi:MAG: flagellar basal body L-ring protein FlgH [Gammaproteobacteria bacterium]|nr:flagellar basal body L-ring protein FlgH [Gammaproteobacteria bacterium]
MNIKTCQKQNVLKISALMMGVLLSACSTTHQAVSDPDFAPVRPVSSQPLPISDGAIYKAGFNVSLFEDIRAHRVGDVITIILQERTNARKSASTTTKKDSEIALAVPTVFGKGILHRGNPILSASVDASRSFAGEGDSQQSNSLTGRISVTVAEVLANGNLVVRGEKLLTLNQGSEHVRISGIIRIADVTPDNTVQSSQVANAKIIYGGQGVLAESNTKGWLQRVFDSSWWPF